MNGGEQSIAPIASFYAGKDILVTGGCGSIGRALVARLLQLQPKRVRVYDHDESGQFHLQQELRHHPALRPLIGDVRDKVRLHLAMRDVDIVFHAAALKHVPLCEYNPFEAVATNVLGTQNVIDVARAEGVSRVLAISTDKAVNPINTMGATKLLSEKLMLTGVIGDAPTRFACVRFGNVLDSDGSVIPIFRRQIAQGGPVTLTHPEMSRFFMAMHDAVNLILHAGILITGGEIFILKMQRLRVKELAEVMIETLAQRHGHAPESIAVQEIGIRPGEKMHEELLTREERRYAEDLGGMYRLKIPLSLPFQVSPHLPALAGGTENSFSSNTPPFVQKEELRILLEQHGILG